METVDEYTRAAPSARLRTFVGSYSGYRQCGIEPGLHRGVPSPYLTLIFTMHEPLVVAAHPDPRQAPGRYDAIAGGLHLTPALIRHEGWQSGVQVGVSPLGCRALFGMPAGELAGLDVDAADLLGVTVVDEVRGRLLAADGWPARFAAVDMVLTRVLRENAVPRQVAYVFGRLLRTDVSVAALAGEVGWSGRHLTDRFRSEIGLRPKEAARVARFDRARRALRPASRLADIAAAHGFADQSHFVREFQAFAGCAPSRWLAEEFGFVQAAQAAQEQDHGHG